jgi:signal transduction histidine kinase
MTFYKNLLSLWQNLKILICRRNFRKKMQTTFSQQSALDLSREKTNTSSQMREVSDQKNNLIEMFSPLAALCTGFVIAVLIFAAWRCEVFKALTSVLFATRWTHGVDLNEPQIGLAAFVLAFVSLGTAFLVERGAARNVFWLVIGFFLLWFAAAAAAAQILKIDLLVVPAIFAGALTFLAVQIRLLFQIENELTTILMRTAMREHLLENRRAADRVASGLELLQTVLPLDEIVVFKLGRRGELNAVGRTRDAGVNKMKPKPNHAEWREGVELCDKAIQTGEPAIKQIGNLEGVARVAVPLVHENHTLGALLVHFRENFEYADRMVLTAFAAQFARSLQRQQTREQAGEENSIFDFLSRRAAEKRLEAFRTVSGLLTEQQFGSLAFAEMPDGYAIAYLDGTLAYANRAMLKAAQLSFDKAKQLDLFSLLERFKGGVFDEPRIAIRRVMQTGEPYRHEIYFVERNQTFDLQIALVYEPPGGNSINEAVSPMNKPLCFIITVRDVTALKENEKLRSDMVSLMSHEIRTPITSISGFAELLMLEDNIPAEAQEFLRIISNESQRLSKMLNTFLAMSKLEQSDKREIVKIPIRLDNLAHEVVVNLQSEARKKRIRLVEQANAHLPPVAGDKGLVTKVIHHLVDNAIRYSPERTTITISTILEAEAVRVIVEDRGYGIPSDSLEKVWEKFYRVPRDGQDKNETSTGLGLSFVKEVVEQHGGAVSLESEPNQGSKFSFTLPRL